LSKLAGEINNSVKSTFQLLNNISKANGNNFSACLG